MSTFFLLVGLPCSGQDRILKKQKEQLCRIVPGDQFADFRSYDYAGYEELGDNWEEDLEALEAAARLLAEGHDVVYPSLALNRYQRTETLKRIRCIMNRYDGADEIDYACIEAVRDPKLCRIINNSKKSGRIPDALFVKMQKKYSPVSMEEGFSFCIRERIPLREDNLWEVETCLVLLQRMLKMRKEYLDTEPSDVEFVDKEPFDSELSETGFSDTEFAYGRFSDRELSDTEFSEAGFSDTELSDTECSDTKHSGVAEAFDPQDYLKLLDHVLTRISKKFRRYMKLTFRQLGTLICMAKLVWQGRICGFEKTRLKEHENVVRFLEIVYSIGVEYSRYRMEDSAQDAIFEVMAFASEWLDRDV